MGIDTAAIRQFLFERFDDEELKHLCFDYFTDVYHDFTSGMRKSQMVQLLLEHCQEQGRLPALMAAMERERPELYATMFAPAADAPPPARTSERDPGQIFVSYAHQDSHFARRLAQDLRQQGLSVWIAPDSIRPGEKWVEAINRGLDESGVFVLALTPNAVESRWVKDETHVAIELNAEEKLRFMPLLVKPCDIPPLWRVHQQINFHNAYYSGLSELLATLGIEDFEPPDEDELSGLSALPAWARLASALALLVVVLVILSQVLPGPSNGNTSEGEPLDPVLAATQVTASSLAEPTGTTTPAEPISSPEAEETPDAAESSVWPGFLEAPGFQGEIGLGETVSVARLDPGEIHTWLFSDGPATVDIILEGGSTVNYQLWIYDHFATSFDDRLPRGYVDFNTSGGGEELTFLDVPEDDDHIIAVVGSIETASSYELTISESVPGTIGLEETVEGTLAGDNPGVWHFSDGPATINIILSLGPTDAGLILLFDDSGNQLESRDIVDADGILRLTNVAISDDREYGIVVRDVNNDGANYSLTIEEAN